MVLKALSFELYLFQYTLNTVCYGIFTFVGTIIGIIKENDYFFSPPWKLTLHFSPLPFKNPSDLFQRGFFCNGVVRKN